MELRLSRENVGTLANELRGQRYRQIAGQRQVRQFDLLRGPLRRRAARQGRKQVFGLAYFLPERRERCFKRGKLTPEAEHVCIGDRSCLRLRFGQS